MDLFYNTETEQFEMYEAGIIELISGTLEYVRYTKPGEKWQIEPEAVKAEVLEDAVVMGVLRHATKEEAASLGFAVL